jgi:hypothetical protein
METITVKQIICRIRKLKHTVNKVSPLQATETII